MTHKADEDQQDEISFEHSYEIHRTDCKRRKRAENCYKIYMIGATKWHFAYKGAGDMYIDYLSYKNIGPIVNLEYHFRNNTQGVPVPLVLVGKNGSGKSILLSNIVDAFYEIAGQEYNNALVPSNGGHQYYKTIMPAHITFGKNYMLAHIGFTHSEKQIEYIFKSGNITYDDYEKSNSVSTAIDKRLNWGEEQNYKNVTVEKSDVSAIFEKEVICFFGPNRYMKPVWMGAKYNVLDSHDDVSTYSLRPNYAKELKNPITPTNLSDLTLQWLFDVITDSRADLAKNENGYHITYPSSNDIDLLSIARQNVEKVMSAILDEEIVFQMGNRSSGQRRFSIIRKSDGTLIANSLDALSTGQLSLFNMFATIIRYADVDDINLSHRLEEIVGVVVIDEIELHLHTKLQRDVLPKLLALFPRIQFIITSHAPLFLLGMKEQFGDDGYDVIEMPFGIRTSAEQFSEFEDAYRYYSQTEKYQQDIKIAIESKKDKTLIITEGATDWKHMEAAYVHLCSDERCSEWLPSLDFEFLEYEPENSNTPATIKLNMSESQLRLLCEQHSLVPQPRKIICIADRDKQDAVKKLEVDGCTFKSWGNNVFSLCLPIPDHRVSTPEICIEHYYSDAEIKTTVDLGDGILRRLFLGNEFDSDGFSNLEDNYYCKDKNACGEDSIAIIDGSKQKKVIHPRENPSINYCLPKSKFADLVLKGEEPFDRFDFSNFIPLFNIIRDILAAE